MIRLEKSVNSLEVEESVVLKADFELLSTC
jgi:hypothetical protein